MRRLLLIFCFCFSLGDASAVVPSVGGSAGIWSNCLSSQSTAKIYVSYFSSDAAALSQLCIALYRAEYAKSSTSNYWLTFIGCSGNLMCDYNVKQQSKTGGAINDYGTYRDVFKDATLPAGASCSSGVFDSNTNACVGGTASCVSGTPKVLTELICMGVDTYVREGEPDCKTRLPIAKVLAFEGCEYRLTDSPPYIKECWQSKTSANIYCSFNFVADGFGAVSGVGAGESAVVSAESAVSNKCVTPGGCTAAGDLPSLVPASDGTTGGTGVTACGAEGQPACQGGLESGTTGCGGSGQPVCVASNTGGGGSGSSEETVTEIKKIGEFLTGGSTDAAVDPVAAKASDLGAAGLDGGSKMAGILGWRLPSHSSQCPTGSFALFGKTITLNSHCSIVDDLMVNFRNLMTAVFVLCAFIIVMKA